MAAGMAASLAMAVQERATSGDDAGCDAEGQDAAQSASDDAHDDEARDHAFDSCAQPSDDTEYISDEDEHVETDEEEDILAEEEQDGEELAVFEEIADLIQRELESESDQLNATRSLEAIYSKNYHPFDSKADFLVTALFTTPIDGHLSLNGMSRLFFLLRAFGIKMSLNKLVTGSVFSGSLMPEIRRRDFRNHVFHQFVLQDALKFFIVSCDKLMNYYPHYSNGIISSFCQNHTDKESFHLQEPDI